MLVQTFAIPEVVASRIRNLNYLSPQSNINTTRILTFLRTIRLWNSLPVAVQASQMLAVFATMLASLPLRYLHETM